VVSTVVSEAAARTRSEGFRQRQHAMEPDRRDQNVAGRLAWNPGGSTKGVLRLLIVQSGFYRSALQLGNIPIVLPFVCAELSVPLWMAALVFPAFTAGGAIGNVLAPKALDLISRRYRLFIVVGTLAVLAAVNALCASIGNGFAAGIVLVANAIPIGAVSAFSYVAFADLVAALPSGSTRAQLLLTEAGAGAALTAAATVGLTLLLPHAENPTKNIHLLWASCAAMAIAAAMCLAIPRRLVAKNHIAPSLRDLVRIGWATVRAERWYRDYLFVQVLFGSVLLGSSFYSVRVAAIPGDTNDQVILVVTFVCVGLLAGIPFWNRIREKFGLIGLCVGSALVSVAAAVLSGAFVITGTWPNIVEISVIIVLASVANQSTFAAGQLWISHYADPRLRVFLISFGQLVISAGLIALSSLLGIIEQGTEALWPVAVILLLNLAAAYSAKRLAPRDH
jgi:MFS family permease